MRHRTMLLAAGLGLLAVGAGAPGPVQAATDVVEYFATEASCRDAGELRKQYQKWQGFQCRQGADPTAPAGQTTAPTGQPAVVWFLVPEHTPVLDTPPSPQIPGPETAKDILTEQVKP